MQHQPTASQLVPSKSGVLVVDGYGIHLRVERGHLVVSDGVGLERRAGRFARAIPGFRRFVILGRSGFMTFEALRWLADVGIGWIHLDPDGRVLATSSSLGLDDPRLRRAQAMAWETPAGIRVAQDLLRAKLAGQAVVAADLRDAEAAATTIERLVPELDRATSPAELMIVEAAAAAAYWDAWTSVSIPWIRADEARVPTHWRTVGGRASPLTGNPRLSANPANAILNYLYAILEAEARLACLGTGLDPGLGVLHADQKSRDSLALDVMEAVRPDVDAYVLELLQKGAFRADDFYETRQGVCRVLPPLTHRLAETAPVWARQLAPVVERVAASLVVGSGSKAVRLPTPLTGTHRSAGRDGIRRRSPKRSLPPVPRTAQICRHCGADVADGQRWCNKCRPAVLLETGLEALRRARAQRAELYKQGRDPSTSDTAKAKNREGRLRRRAEERVWDEAHPERPDVQDYLTNVLPRVQRVPVRQLAHASGLSVTHCAYIRRGERVPHPRWWSRLLAAAERVSPALDGSESR